MLAVINDAHLGAIRSGGTTPTTARQLRYKLGADFNLLLSTINMDLCVNGDLFDTRNVPLSDLLMAYSALKNWAAQGHRLYMSAGNHDESKDSMTLSSFRFLASMLKDDFPDTVTVIEGALAVPEHDAYIISHVPNQELFNLELAKVPECKFLLLHCNYDNHFAVESDNSLNLSREQAEALPVQHIVLGHEHQARTMLEGRVVIVGNQFPSSVSDCIGEDFKVMVTLDAEAGVTQSATWRAEGCYSEQDWKSLTDEGEFIRVTGSASAEEASQVVAAIAKFRATANALVITNAVRIAGIQDGQQIEVSLEQIQGFSVLKALLNILTQEEGTTVTKLMGDYSVKQT